MKLKRLAAFGALPAAGAVIALSACGPTTSTHATPPPTSTHVSNSGGNAGSASVPPTTQAPPMTTAPAPKPTVSKVVFKVTGSGEPSIMYGSSSDNRDGGGTLGMLGDGNATPWTRSMTLDPNASYYSLNAQLEGGGSISCSITVDGKVVSSGHASGGYNICDAQAAPPMFSGDSWTNENQ